MLANGEELRSLGSMYGVLGRVRVRVRVRFRVRVGDRVRVRVRVRVSGRVAPPRDLPH